MHYSMEIFQFRIGMMCDRIILIMGNDHSYTSGVYLVNGESAYLKIYDASNGSTLNVTPAEELPGFSNNGILIINGTSIANTTIKN